MQNSCETCRHWSLEGKGYALKKADYGICLLSECYDGRPVDDKIFFAADGESYYAILVTYKAFGCNQWKETKTGQTVDA